MIRLLWCVCRWGIWYSNIGKIIKVNDFWIKFDILVLLLLYMDQLKHLKLLLVTNNSIRLYFSSLINFSRRKILSCKGWSHYKSYSHTTKNTTQYNPTTIYKKLLKMNHWKNTIILLDFSQDFLIIERNTKRINVLTDYMSNSLSISQRILMK